MYTLIEVRFRFFFNTLVAPAICCICVLLPFCYIDVVVAVDVIIAAFFYDPIWPKACASLSLKKIFHI